MDQEINITTKEFVNKAVSCYLELMEHSNVYYNIIKNEALLTQLINDGIVNQRINFYIQMIDKLKTFECEICGSKLFAYECPIALCDKCHTEYLLKDETCLPMCKECPSYSLGTCIARKLIPENKNERKTNFNTNGWSPFQRLGKHVKPDTDDPAER